MVTPEHFCWAVPAVPTLPGTGEPHTALSAAAVSPCPAGRALCNTSWDPIGLLGHRGTQLAHGQHLVHHWSTTGQPLGQPLGQLLVNHWPSTGQPLSNQTLQVLLGQLLAKSPRKPHSPMGPREPQSGDTAGPQIPFKQRV